MKNFKKIIKIVTTIFLIAGLASCKNQSGNMGNKPTPQPTPEAFVITFSNPEHGTLTAKRANGDTEFKSGDTASKDEVINFTVAPEANYEVEAWIGATQNAQDNPPEVNTTVEGVSFIMKKIPEGKNIKLGSASFAVNPIHTIESISEFYMGETEVTQELWNAIMKNNPSWFNGDSTKPSKQAAQGEEQTKRPVESVSWYDAVNFCNELTKAVIGSESECVYTITDIEKTNTNYPNVITKAKVSVDFSKKGYRLPTEAEWEWAAKGGKEDAEYPGVHQEPNEDRNAFKKRVLEYAWTDLHPNTQRRTHEVKKLKANEYGLYDMAGNVMEWCYDWWSELEENKQYEKDYSGVAIPDANMSIKIQKGGSYMYPTTLSELATRSDNSKTQLPESISKDRGFRIVIRK